MQPWHITADKGYVGLGCDTPFKRRPGRPLLEWQKRFNKGINQIRYVVERSIAHLKTWRILSTPCRLPQPTTIRAINVIRKIMFYQPPAEPHFPSNWISFKLRWLSFDVFGWLEKRYNAIVISITTNAIKADISRSHKAIPPSPEMRIGISIRTREININVDIIPKSTRRIKIIFSLFLCTRGAKSRSS